MHSPPIPAKALTVFYSYAHEDEGLRKKLEKQLSFLKRQEVISEWHDRDIQAGQEWSFEVSRHLDTANIILLLISPDFLASNYCYSIEMKRAIEKHNAKEAHVIPIILRPVYWKDTPFGKLQALPTNEKPVTRWSNRDEAFLNIATHIRDIIIPVTISHIANRTSINESCQSAVTVNTYPQKQGDFSEEIGKSNANIDFSMIIMQILHDFRRKNDKLYLFPDIPETKLINARKACKISDSEQIIALIDNTVFGSGSDCVLFGAKCVYYHRALSTPGVIRYVDFPHRTFTKSRFTPKLIVTDYGDDLSIAGSNIPSNRFCDLLNIIKHSVRSTSA